MPGSFLHVHALPSACTHCYMPTPQKRALSMPFPHPPVDGYCSILSAGLGEGRLPLFLSPGSASVLGRPCVPGTGDGAFQHLCLPFQGSQTALHGWFILCRSFLPCPPSGSRPELGLTVGSCSQDAFLFSQGYRCSFLFYSLPSHSGSLYPVIVFAAPPQWLKTFYSQ